MTTRTAVIRLSRNQDEHTVAAYLPGNYRVVGVEPNPNVPGTSLVTIEGDDDHGWTLDGYVLPRLASGMLYGDETTEGAHA